MLVFGFKGFFIFKGLGIVSIQQTKNQEWLINYTGFKQR